MQKSAIFNMNLFESGDPVKAEFFNENTQILEAALQYRPRMVMGIYNPPANSGSTATKTLTFDAPPLLVGVVTEGGMVVSLRGSGTVATAFAAQDSAYTVSAAWDGSSVTFTGNVNHQLFGSAKTSIYFALLGEAEDSGEQ